MVSYRDVTHHFMQKNSSIQVLDNVSFDVNDGEFVSIVGPSGCGKTTLLRLTLGLVQPTSGEILLNDKAVKGAQTNVGVVFQTPVLLKWKKVMDNILFQLKMRDLDVQTYEESAKELVKLAGLQGFENSYPSELSGGMQQRVAICRALIHDPPVLFMDEPFGALDAITRDQMNVELTKIWEERRKTVLLVTHSIQESIFLSDRVIVMSRRPGKLVSDIKIDLHRPRTTEVRESQLFTEYERRIRRELGGI